MTRYKQHRLLIFSKAPIPGQVKTRLSPQLTPDECALLHTALIQYTLETALHSGIPDIELWCCPDQHHPAFIKFAEQYPIKLKTQQGGNLGARMYHAIASSLSEVPYVTLIGTDCPAMQASYIQTAFTQLESNYDITLGPAEDGGYVLIAARKIRQAIFEHIDWGSECVYRQTYKQLQQSDLHWCHLTSLWDIDYPRDLLRLHTTLNIHENKTKQLLSAIPMHMSCN